MHALLTRLTLDEHAADDLLQELFVRLSVSRRFAKAAHPHVYAARAAINLAFEWRRKRKRHPITLNGHASVAEPSATITSTDLEPLLTALQQLRPIARDAVVLRHVHNLPYEAVGAAIDRSPHHARAMCHRGLTRLRELLEEGAKDELNP